MRPARLLSSENGNDRLTDFTTQAGVGSIAQVEGPFGVPFATAINQQRNTSCINSVAMLAVQAGLLAVRLPGDGF